MPLYDAHLEGLFFLRRMGRRYTVKHPHSYPSICQRYKVAIQTMILKKYFLTTFLLLLWVMTLYGQNNHHLYPTKKQKDSLGKVLDKLIYSDQQYRWMISFGELDEQKIAEFRKMTGDEILERMIAARSNKIGISKFKKDSLTKIQEEIDSSNFSTLIGLIYNFGYPVVPGCSRRGYPKLNIKCRFPTAFISILLNVLVVFCPLPLFQPV